MFLKYPKRTVAVLVLFTVTFATGVTVGNQYSIEYKARKLQAQYFACMDIEAAKIATEMHDGGFNPEAVAHLSKMEAATTCCRKQGRIAVEAANWVVICIKPDISELIYRSPEAPK